MDAPAPAPEPLLTWPELLARPRPTPDASVPYGPEPLQRVDLWLPAGAGPHPVVLMVHGGCWQSEVADRRIMNWVADDLRVRGVAVWNIDYRGVDRAGGSYPGTFRDAAAAADALREHAPRHRLDHRRLPAIGHSAGGHLALWLAARHRLPADSPLRAGDPLPIARVISLGGLPDLELAARPPGSGCGTEVVAALTGGRYADTSVPRLLPIDAEQLLINGREDGIVPLSFAEDYVRRARAAGDLVELRLFDRTGHVELIAPESVAWSAVAAQVERWLERGR